MRKLKRKGTSTISPPVTDAVLTPKRRRSASKSIPSEVQNQSPEGSGVNIELEVLPEPKIIKRYPKQVCASEGCSHWAVGSGDVCRKHGGNPVIPENLITPDQMTDLQLMSIYDPVKHPMLYIECSRAGMSEVEIAAQMEVSTPTIKAWSTRYAEFNSAFEIGKGMQEAWWLTEGKDNLDNRNYNTGMFKFLTGNKIGYSEKIESKNLHVHAGVLKVPAAMTADEWEDKANE